MSTKTRHLDLYSKCKRMIAFIYEPSQIGDGTPTEEDYPEGTGFMFAFPLEGRTVFYVITNKHVLLKKESGSAERSSNQRVFIRFNNREDTAGLFEKVDLLFSGPYQNVWQHSNQAVDLAAIEVSFLPDVLPEGFTEKNVHSQELFSLSVGDPACSIGYLSGYAGKAKMYPVVRFGRIALLSDETWFSSDRDKSTPEQAYLAEFQAVGGASGSPVILDVPQRPDVPVIIGVIKAAMKSRGLDASAREAQGLVAVEPPEHLLSLVQELKQFVASKLEKG